MAIFTPSKKKKVLMQELQHYTSLLAQFEKNKRSKGLNLLDVSSCSGRKTSPKNFNFKTSVHSFNTKSSHWNFKDNKHTYFSRHSTKKVPTTLSKNILPHTLKKQLNPQEDKSINNSFKLFPCSKTYEKVSLKSFSKQNDNFSQKRRNIISKKCDYKTSKDVQESVQAKKDSKKLIGEIMAITHELKLKSKTLGSFCGQRIPQERDGSNSKIKSLKVATRDIQQNKDSLSHYSPCNNEKDLILRSSSSSFQIPAVHSSKCSKIISCRNSGNKTMHSHVQPKLNRTENFLERSSSGTNKKLSNHLTQKTNTMCGMLNNHSKEANIKSIDKLVKSLKPEVESTKIKKQNLKFNAIANKNNLKPCQTSVFSSKLYNNCSSSFKKATQLSKSSNKLKNKYKIVNKTLATERILTKKTAATNCIETLKLSNLRKRNLSSYKLTNIGIKKTASKRNLSSYKLTNIGLKKTASNSKMFFNHLSLKNSPLVCVESQCGNLGRQKYVNNYFIKKQNFIRSYMPECIPQNKPIEIHNASGVDTDLLLELAAENDLHLKQISQRHLYKSKNRIINNHSVQKRTAKMIKLKYFNPNRKCIDWRILPTKTFKGFSKRSIAELNKRNKSFTRINKRNMRFSQNVSNKFQTPKVHLQNKKIVTLKGERFIIGSDGKSLKKLKQTSKCKKKTKRAFYNKSLSEALFPEKISSPASKIMANRVLNLSINRMLSASEKKKINKVNTYCMFYNRFGRCNKGVECPYVHDPSKIAVCTRFLRGTCKNDKCPFSHEVNPGKMAICSFFLQDICTNTHCPYRHEKLSSDAKLCKDFVQGYCLQGKECKKAHVLICPKYIQGMCEKGKLCAFPHPVARDKKILSKESITTEKTVDNLSETVRRYFESNHDGNVAKGLVVPRRKTLPEQPSYISLTLDESS